MDENLYFREWLSETDLPFMYESWFSKLAMPAALLAGMAGKPSFGQAPSFSSQPANISATAPVGDLPNAQDQQKAFQQINQIFKADVAKANTPAAKTALAQKLLSVATDTSDLASRYVLLNQARTLAAQGGDGKTVLQSIDAMAQSFKMDALKAKADALAQSPVKLDGAEWEKLIADAVEKDNFQAARVFVNCALRDPSLTKKFSGKTAELQQIETASAGAKAALSHMDTDPAAKTTAASFLAFYKNLWSQALPLMQAGSDKNLAHLAELELSKPTETEKILELANGWWDIPLTGIAQKNVKQHAVELYRGVVDKLQGLQKIEVEKKIAADVENIYKGVVGSWKMQSGSWGVKVVLKPDGTIAAANGLNGKWSIAGNKVKITWNGTNNVDVFDFPKDNVMTGTGSGGNQVSLTKN